MVALAAMGLHPHATARLSHAQPEAAPIVSEGASVTEETAAPVASEAERLALYQQRLADFRKIEDRFFGVRAPRHISAWRRGPSVPVARGRTDLECLAQAVYYEARSEPALGQAAVAQVVLNRAHDPRYPKSVCGVVYQGAEHRGCQFSFACDGSMSRGGDDVAAWAEARAVASKALSGSVVDAVGASLNYHANYVSPTWAQRLLKVAAIGRHIFYSAVAGVLPPGATAPQTGETSSYSADPAAPSTPGS